METFSMLAAKRVAGRQCIFKVNHALSLKYQLMNTCLSDDSSCFKIFWCLPPAACCLTTAACRPPTAACRLSPADCRLPASSKTQCIIPLKFHPQNW
jgi:hypothetical protein